ncbi:MAG: methionine--tRNA ligase [Gammaproteobacteria bacterium]|nr:methionine--tRNA ligase [Gammaproteobacteria bacterium]
MSRRRILATNALFYANGPLHLGHMIEAIQSDVWTRFQKLCGHECHYIGGEDAHGTPVMLRARAEGVEAEELIERMGASHRADLEAFHVHFDNYYTTHSPENREYAEAIYRALDAAGHIERRSVKQAYDEEAGMFLPDRFVKGECPNCGTPDQYGDACENCGATYTPADLGNAVSVVSGTRPVLRESEHFFFRLSNFEAQLREWVGGGHVQSAIANKLKEWFEAGLRDWDISRDEPYFGFEIPGAPGKYFYVWLDAPIGYMASFRDYCNRNVGLEFDEFWDRERAAEAGTELNHFIGKDIAYFHTLFWPAMLMGSGHRTPDGVYAHGYLTMNGKKMSKSRGTFITARSWLEFLDAEYLRYYFAAKLGRGVEDIDLNLDDFLARVNSDLVGKYVNIASRSAGFLHKYFDSELAAVEKPLFDGEAVGTEVAALYEKRGFSAAMIRIMELADEINAWWNDKSPWVLARKGKTKSGGKLHRYCSTAVDAFRQLTILLKPVLPETAQRVEAFLDVEPFTWDDLGKPLPAGHRINRYEHLMRRVEPEAVTGLLEASRATRPAQESAPAGKSAAESNKETNMDPIADEITIDDFAKIDLRVARIAVAEHVEGADKLLRLELDLGGETRQVFAGIKAAYDPDTLVGKQVVMVANLKPRKMRFGLSEGMVLAAGPGGKDIFVIAPDDGAEPGMKVK